MTKHNLRDERRWPLRHATDQPALGAMKLHLMFFCIHRRPGAAFLAWTRRWEKRQKEKSRLKAEQAGKKAATRSSVNGSPSGER
jgi:hypothetical protein